MRFDDRAANRKTHPGAAGFRREERLEDALRVVRIDPGSGILRRHQAFTIRFSGGNGVTYSGFVNGQTASVLSGTIAYGGSSQGAVNAGTYTIIPSNQTSTNYAINYVDGTLTINPANDSAVHRGAML